MPLTGTTAWRSAALGPMRELHLNGCTLRGYEAGEGEPLLFVHGMLTNANVWRKLVDRLQDRYRCLTLDLPMGGHLVPVGDQDLSPTGIAGLVVQALDAWRLERVTIVGSDTGTAVCQVVATTAPERLNRLILTSGDFRSNSPAALFQGVPPLGWIPGAAWVYLLPGYLRPLQRLPLAYGWLAKRPQDPDAVDSYFLPTLQDAGIHRDFRAFLRGYRRRHAEAAANALGAFDRPALIAWSREDRLFPPRHAEELAHLLPDARLTWIDDSYTLSAEDQPDALAAAVAEFLERTPAAGPALTTTAAAALQ
jgi:pimeloyl-ACP methyl ester carboxylesterase